MLLPEDERPDEIDMSGWDVEWGDRCQQIVWIGIHMDEQYLRSMLDDCLLTDAEMKMGPEEWEAVLEDPLPAWITIEEDVGEEEEGEEEA